MPASRYRKLPPVSYLDRQGHLRRSRPLRLPAPTDAVFEHVLGENERLDHLAAKYYRQPQNWWHICDANPEFLSPLALVGTEPIVTDEFPLVFADRTTIPQANDLLRRLSALNGVEHVALKHTSEIVPEIRQISPAESITVQIEHFQWIVAVTYNATTITTAQIGEEIMLAGFTIQTPGSLRRTGKRILIPPDTAG